MASSINASTSGAGGVITTADNTGILNLQTASTNAVTVDASQNVGIGTTSPSSKLTVASSNVTVNAGYGIAFTGDQDRIMTPEDNVSGALIKWSSGGICRFSAASTERMRIDSSGLVLVNRTSASGTTRLQVNGISGSAAAIETFHTSTGTQNHLQFNNGSVVGTISTNGSSTAYNTSSDYRLKENIVPMTGALATVQALKPVTYKWKIDGSDGQGFIAHELQEVVPDCVSGEKDAVDEEGKPVHQGVDTSFLVATLTAAIQEMKAIIDEQSVTINDLKARVTALEAK